MNLLLFPYFSISYLFTSQDLSADHRKWKLIVSSHFFSVPAAAEGQYRGPAVLEIMRDKTMMNLATCLFGLTGNGGCKAAPFMEIWTANLEAGLVSFVRKIHVIKEQRKKKTKNEEKRKLEGEQVRERQERKQTL